MEENQPIGIIKFFRDEGNLDKLLEGCFYCTTPESYRISKLEGVSDKYESCIFSYRASRDEAPITVSVAGQDLASVMGVTIQKSSDPDSWLHCWMSLRFPSDHEELTRLKCDIERMQSEFGSHYAYIPVSSLRGFVELLGGLSKRPMWCSEVTYSQERQSWSSKCKSTKYNYQREYRFGFGECGAHETVPYIINHETGFRDFILKNPEIMLLSEESNEAIFELRQK